MDLIPINLKSNQMAIKNCLYLPSVLAKDPQATVHVKIKNRIIKTMFSPIIEKTNIGASKNLRDYLGLDLVHAVKVVPQQPLDEKKDAIKELKISLITRKNHQKKAEIDQKMTINSLKQNQRLTVFNLNQSFYIKVKSVVLEATILALKTKSKNAQLGVLIDSTEIIVVQSDLLPSQKSNTQTNISQPPKGSILSSIKDKFSKQKSQGSTKGSLNTGENFDPVKMGIGGLDAELFNIFRRTFASRRFSNQDINRFGIKHVKGILLYGPPGTGKTLIARQLAKFLNIKEGHLQIVNGPEIFSKFVGESEQNIRKLFAKAREDQNRYGQDSPTHVIVFDEIDAICKQRGVYSGGTNVNDQVVNQLLSVIDGVDALNNIIVIGMTNRKDLLDQAILRPGRFEVHVEVTLPNAKGRQQILSIHTAKLRQNKILQAHEKIIKDVSLWTRNYTGAEIESLVKSASSYAITRSTNVMDFSSKLKIDQKNLKVTEEDFLKAIKEVKPQFGVDQDKFDGYFRQQMVSYGGSLDQNTNDLQEALKFNEGSNVQVKTALLYGVAGSGKTSLAISYAKHCSAPYIKIISPQNLVGQSDAYKIVYMNKIFDDAYKTSRSCIVIDNIERLIEYSAVGRRFSNPLLQTLLVLLNKSPPSEDSKLSIIVTTSSYDHMEALGVTDCFTAKINVPLLNREEVTEFVRLKYVNDASVAEKIGRKLNGVTIRNVLEIGGLLSPQSYNKPEEWIECYKMISTVEDPIS